MIKESFAVCASVSDLQKMSGFDYKPTCNNQFSFCYWQGNNLVMFTKEMLKNMFLELNYSIMNFTLGSHISMKI